MATSLNDDEKKQVLGEVLMDELKAIHEYVQDIPQMKSDISSLKASVGRLESDMQVVKAAIRDRSHELTDHEKRITKLESVPA